MRILKYFFLIVIVIFFNQVLVAQTMSIKEAISKALNQNTQLKENSNNLDITREALKVAWGGLLPTVGVSGGYNWQNTWGKSDSSFQTGNNSSWSLGIGGNVMLFDGLSSYANINQKQSSLNSANYDLEKLKQDVILQTVNYYLAIVSSKELLEFQKEDLKYNQALLDKIKQMYAIKVVAVTDVFSQDAQTANSELSYLQAENAYEKAKVALLNYLAMDVTADYTFSIVPGEVPDSTMIPSSFDNLFEIALANRQDFKSSDAKVKAAEYQLKYSEGALFPRLTGSYDLSTNGAQANDLFKQRTLSLGVNLNFPIFSQFTIEYAIEFADIQLKNSREDLTATERQIKTDVKNSFLDMETAKKEFDVSKKGQESAEQSWKAKQEMYTLGAATYLDLQLTYNNYLHAKYTVISTEYGYIYSKYQMLATLGQLQQ